MGVGFCNGVTAGRSVQGGEYHLPPLISEISLCRTLQRVASAGRKTMYAIKSLFKRQVVLLECDVLYGPGITTSKLPVNTMIFARIVLRIQKYVFLKTTRKNFVFEEPPNCYETEDMSKLPEIFNDLN